ncbi:MAG: hypothetical protein HRT38_19265 [Alteromonadaceae bacterium]|nr:hypothetical protein [Alteromonadaceae bacterium]
MTFQVGFLLHIYTWLAGYGFCSYLRWGVEPPEGIFDGAFEQPLKQEEVADGAGSFYNLR